MRRAIFAAALVLPLAGCGMPTPLSIASLVLDVGSYAVSGKTTTDIALSAVAGEDCQVIRVLDGDPCISPDDYELALGVLEPLPDEGAAPAVPTQTLRQVAALGIDDAREVGGLDGAGFLSDDLHPGTRLAQVPAAFAPQRIEQARFVSDDLRPDTGTVQAVRLEARATAPGTGLDG